MDLKSCGYKIQKDFARAQRLEWEHVVPAEAFGQSFLEWREGSSSCIKKGKMFKGRKCAEMNPEFRRMDGDLYNLFPEIGELNRLRSNFSMAQFSTSLECRRWQAFEAKVGYPHLFKKDCGGLQ